MALTPELGESMKSEMELLASTIALFQSAGGSRRRYPEELRIRVCDLYRKLGGSRRRFAQSLGISETAATKWILAGRAASARMLPVRMAQEVVDQVAPPGGAITLTYRNIVIGVPPTTPAAQIASLVQAMAEG